MPSPAIAPAALEAGRDQDIIDCLRGGAVPKAFDMLAARYETKIFRLCYALLRDPAAAEDAAQESLVRIWKALASFDGRASLSTWIYAITRNRCLSAIERRRDQASLSDPAIELEVEMTMAAAQVGSAHTDSGLLRELVQELPERYRRPLLLFYFEDQSLEQVAAMLALPTGTIKTHLHRARGRLLERLRSLGLGDLQHWLESTT